MARFQITLSSHGGTFSRSDTSPLGLLLVSTALFLGTTLLLSFNQFLAPNGGTPLSHRWLLAPAALAAGYAVVWFRAYRRRPQSEPIVVQYRPPQEFTPAQARSLHAMTCDGRTYVACIVSLAARGLINISPERDGVYLSPASNPSPCDLPEEELCVLQSLFQASPFAPLKPAGADLQAKLSWLMVLKTGACLHVRRDASLAGIGATIVTALVMAWNAGMLRGKDFDSGFTAALLLVFSLFFAGLAGISYWQRNRRAVLLAWRGIYPASALVRLILPLLILPLFFWLFMRMIAPLFALTIGLMLLLITLAPPFLTGYTAQGARLLRQLLGFRQFLATTESDRLNRMAQPAALSPADLSLLAYAVALDVRVPWADRLGAEALAETSLDLGLGRHARSSA